MNSTFLLLLLGHLAGDFVFQTSRIAENKNKNLKYLGLHSLIILLCEFLSLLPSWSLENAALVFLLSAIHFAIDYIKYRFQRCDFTKTILYYFLDQATHLCSIFLISAYVQVGYPFIDSSFAFLTVTFILNAYFIDLIAFFLFDSKLKKKYTRDITGYVLRGVSFFFFVFNIYAGIVELFSGFFVQIGKSQTRKSVICKYLLCLLLNFILLFFWRNL